MKYTILLLLSLLIFVTGCGPPMTSRQKVLFVAMVAANVWDYESTRRLHVEDDDGKVYGDYVVTFSERNPFLDDHPSRDQVALLKIGFVATLWGLGEIWPDGRDFFFALGAGVGAGGGYSNDRMYDKYH